jgi:hypothetical protein
MKYECGICVQYYWEGKAECSEKTSPIAPLSITDARYISLEFNPNLCGKKYAADLSHATVYTYIESDNILQINAFSHWPEVHMFASKYIIHQINKITLRFQNINTFFIYGTK